MRRFELDREEDISGVSGTGRIAEGVEFHDGQCVVSWYGQLHTIEVAPDIETVIGIHGHEGRTRVVWLEDYDPKVIDNLKAELEHLDGSAYVIERTLEALYG